MKLIIDIDEDVRVAITRMGLLRVPDEMQKKVDRAIQRGTPLPKGHGDIIDRSKIEYMKAIHDLKWGKITASECATRIKYSAPTIIEADKE